MVRKQCSRSFQRGSSLKGAIQTLTLPVGRYMMDVQCKVIARVTARTDGVIS